MSTFGSAGGQSSVILQGVSNPQIDNVDLTLANTEYSVTLPTGVRQYLIKLRDSSAELKLRYVSASDFITIPRGCNYSESDLGVTTLTIYLESNSAAQVVELITWS